MAQQVGRAATQSDRAFEGEGVNDLRRGRGVFGVDAVKEGEHVGEKGISGVEGEPGVKGGQRGVVRSRLGKRQADESAHEQVGGEQFFQRRVGAGVGPGADDFTADELLDGEGGRGSRRARGVMKALTGGDDGGGVVEVVGQHQRMVSAAAQKGEDG